MKSRFDLLEAILSDYQQGWGLAVSSRDLEYIRRRYSSEGYPFLASTLPELDDLLLDGLSSLRLRDSRWARNRSCPIPKFLEGLWTGIFTSDGVLLDNPCISSIRAIRQISRAFKKVFEVCDDSYVELAISQFIRTDEELPLSIPFGDELSRVNARLHGKALFDVASFEELNGEHGPGAVAERLDSVARWDFPTVSRSIAGRFDISDFFVKYTEDWPCAIEDPIGRVVPVPKTFTKPRLISIEPSASLFAQKGVLRLMERFMRTIPQINLLDQSRNKDLARRASLDGSLSTIDLSEASDRVSLALVEQVFGRTRSFLNLIADVRTAAVHVDGRTLPLKKFASMGCALTFPIQMLVFRTIIIWALCAQDSDRSPANVRKWSKSRDVGVYGDDIVVPTRYAQSVMRALEVFGLKVNASKSYTTGLFRESCGGDYYAGYAVQPVYVRRQPPRNRRDVDGILSWASLSKLLSNRGLHNAARYCSDLVQSIIGPAPFGEQTEDDYSFEYDQDSHLVVSEPISVSHPWPVKSRYNRHLQRHEVFGPVLSPRRKGVKASEGAILAHALHCAGRAEIDPLRLTHHGRPTGAFISRRWVAAHSC